MSIDKPKRKTTYTLVGYLMVITAAILFGVNGNISRLLFDDGIWTFTLMAFRMLIGGICLMTILIIGTRKGLRVHRRSWGWVVAFGIVLALTAYTYFLAISRLPLAVAIIIIFTAPAWMALWNIIWYRLMPSRYVLIAVGLTVIGVILLTGIWHQNLNGLDLLGLFFAFLGLVTYIAYLLVGRRVGQYLPPLTSTGYGALVASLFWFIVQPPWAIPSNTWTPYHLFLIPLVGTVGMAIPFSLVLGSLRRIDALHVGIASTLELPSAGIIADFWLCQQPDIWQISGFVMVPAGITLLQYENAVLKPIE